MRRVLNENVRQIMEELQGSATTQQAQPGAAVQPGKQPVKPVPVKGNPAQQVAAGVQATAQQAAQQAAATGDAQIQAQLAAQQGVDPKQAAQVNKTNAAQPQPPKISATAQARDQRNDTLDGRAAALDGKQVQATEELNKLDSLVGEEEAAEAGNPDEDDNFNDNPAQDRAKARAKDIFPGAKDSKVAGWGKEGAGAEQKHREVTHPGQKLSRGAVRTEENVSETVFSDAERTQLLDGIFGA